MRLEHLVDVGLEGRDCEVSVLTQCHGSVSFQLWVQHGEGASREEMAETLRLARSLIRANVANFRLH